MIDRDTEVVTLRRTDSQPHFVLIAAWGAIILFAAIWGISDGFTSWKLPAWRADSTAAIILYLFLGVWFGSVLATVWFCSIFAHRVNISSNEIRICLGPIVIRRVSALDVLTVVRTVKTESAFNPQNNPNAPNFLYVTKPHRLVLSTTSAEQLREKARNHATRNAHTVPNSRVCRYMAKAFFRNRFWIKWTPEAENALRKALPAAEFIR